MRGTQATVSPWRNRLLHPSPVFCGVVLFLAVLFFGLIRYRLRDMPMERDEGEYAFAGQLMLEGIPPYKLAYNMKLPGTYAAYAAILAAFGQTPAGIHLGLLFLNAATSVLLYFLTTRLCGRLAGVVAGMSYALLSTSPSVEGFQAHATNFVVFPALLGILLLLRALESGRWWLFLVSGIFSGIAFVMKQHGVFFILFCFVFLVVGSWKEQSRRTVARNLSLFGIGAIVPYAVTCLWLYRAGVFSQFWFWTVSYAGEYSKMGLRRGVRTFFQNFGGVASPAALLWVLAGLGVVAVRWSPAARKRAAFLVTFFAFSFVAICPGAYFRPHYFVLLLPAVAILVGVAINSAAELIAASKKPNYIIALPVLAFLACFASAICQQRAFYFSLTPEQAMRSIYANGSTPFLAAEKLANYIREHTSPDARIAVLGSEPEIYFYAHRLSATGYIYMYGLMERQRYTTRMREEMIREIETNRPEYLVYVDVWGSWGQRDAAPQVLTVTSWAQKFMQEHYQKIAVVDGEPSLEYVWGEAAQTYTPRSDKVLYLLKRKS